MEGWDIGTQPRRLGSRLDDESDWIGLAIALLDDEMMGLMASERACSVSATKCKVRF